ncbi:hypothetical protein M409DRAFT_22071 [Zasmidium cellare ATCC 36951]|uniref:Uncharacterized protein n=1 Tax=Zasmidium cellare ATCC 36951 TaxID=1080233 RepID=A0A6A6CLB2_ZASCE|nr:uncharacterized protein M409DRAFT_22071 [Zasmidium cellare ATCC 36951]KAF2167925.1 hypothetical protein M409DRAFT_22071 [Zasmidium cellare ATCC 36951]
MDPPARPYLCTSVPRPRPRNPSLRAPSTINPPSNGMIVRSRALLPPFRRSHTITLPTIRNESTAATTPQTSAEAQRKALVAARIEAREREAAAALAASRADAAQQHAALVERTRKLNSYSGSDRYIYITAIVLFLATPPVIYFWWRHRAEHMGQKKQAMLEELAERRRVFQESRGK